MPSEWNLTLDGPAEPAIPVEAPHAVVSRWLDVDHRAAVKPYSILPPASVGRATTVTVRLLDDTLGPRLCEAAAAGTIVRLGRHHFTVAKAPVARQVTPWPELATPVVRRAWQVQYVTPVTFRRKQRTSPWPAPDSVLTSLASRWARLRPDCAPTPTRATAASVWVSDVAGRSEPLQLKDTVVSAFFGRLRYVCDGDDTDAATVSALFAFARYAGIGSHTAFGLGAVRFENTWQPRGRNASVDRPRPDQGISEPVGVNAAG